MTAPRIDWQGLAAGSQSGEGAASRPLAVADILRIKAWSLIRRSLAWLEAQAHHGGVGEDLDAAGEDRFGTWRGDDAARRDEDAQLLAADSLLATRGERLTALCNVLGLDKGARFTLELCVALAIDGALREELTRLAGLAGEPGLTEGLLRQLAGPAGPDQFGARTLTEWEIVDLSPRAVPSVAPAVDPFVVAYVCERDDVDATLTALTQVVEPRPALASWPVAAVAQRVTEARRSGTPFQLVVRGELGSGRRTFAAGVASSLGMGAFAVDTSSLEEAEWASVYRRVLRFALLHGCAPVWYGTHATRRAPAVPRQVALQVLVLVPGERASHANAELDLGGPTSAERRLLWRALIPALRGSAAEEIDQLADQFRMQVGEIAAVAQRGVTTAAEARAEARKINRDLLGDLGAALGCPFVREDLRVTPELRRSLDDFLFEARARTAFWEKPEARRLFPRGRGLIGFLLGPPGTGKTMAAQIIAAELKLDLYRIDIAVCLSKYIGETIKNLRQVFAAAGRMNAVFLFDEADALFAKRTEIKDAHDRHANTDTNYLLQLLEDFDGVALLASNRRNNVDPAFMRRIRYILDFPRPGTEERRSIWRQVLGELAGPEVAEALRRPVDALAEIVEMSGAQIKVALVSALFAAAQEGKPLGLPQLYRGINRELLKEGRGVGPKECERIERAALAPTATPTPAKRGAA